MRGKGKGVELSRDSQPLLPLGGSAPPQSSGCALRPPPTFPHAEAALTSPREWVLRALDSNAPTHRDKLYFTRSFQLRDTLSLCPSFSSYCMKLPLDLTCKRFADPSFPNTTKGSHLAQGHRSAPILPTSLITGGSSWTRNGLWEDCGVCTLNSILARSLSHQDPLGRALCPL